MYFTAKQLADSISKLSNVNPFFGITFLVCKKEMLPIDNSIEFALDSQNAQFLKLHHKLNPMSQWLFQPYKSSDRNKKWIRHDYAAKGLQAINTQTFQHAFTHKPKTRVWGWKQDYISVLNSRLHNDKRIPVFHLSVWLYRETSWANNITVGEIINHFIREFKITQAEVDLLFDMSAPSIKNVASIFQKNKPEWDELKEFFPPPPDASPDQGGTLSCLETHGIGPADHMSMKPADRLTLITGDNGLGKTFLLECSWWALTGTWAERPIYPVATNKKKKVEIKFSIKAEHSKAIQKTTAFDWEKLAWSRTDSRTAIPSLIVYARVDGSFAIWDPVRHFSQDNHTQKNNMFTSSEIWDGYSGRIEGLVRDWVRWQASPSKYPFEIFVQVLKKLSPPDLGPLEPGEPTRIPGDPRDIPTLKHPYGLTPIFYSSAGVKRIITLAYLIVWAWSEHLVAAKLRQSAPEQRIVVLIDEMEAHLHPHWQRTVLPAIMAIGDILSPKVKFQFLVATHSPLVMASSETLFNSEIDSLLHLDLDKNGKVNLRELDYIQFGDVSSWLTSPIFELRHARSTEAEKTIEEAKELQLKKHVTKAEVEDISRQLQKYLSSDDKFWPRWISFAEQYNVVL